MRIRAIVNPHSSNNRTGKLWPEYEQKLSSALGTIETAFTDAPLSAIALTRKALDEGVEQVISVGGDGTINEVVNGFFEDDRPVSESASLSILSSGTGGDFRKTFGIPDDIDEQIARIAKSEVRAIDVGKLTYTTFDGNQAVRYFDNIASFGLSGVADREVNNLKYAKLLGGTFAFKWGVLKALLKYRSKRVRIQVDDSFDEVLEVSTAAVCNGQYFGGGMHMAPDASPDDGLFDMVAIADVSLLKAIKDSNLIYEGKHIEQDNVYVVRGRKVIATPVNSSDEVLLDVDGEVPGKLPATFEILPGALRLRA